MRAIPLEVLLSWPTPNYVDPHTQGPALVIVNAIFMVLVVIAVTLRLYTRLYIKRWMGADDILICVALLFTLGLNISVILANVKFYWNRHVWDIPFSAFPAVGKIVIAAKALFTTSGFFTRCSLISFYYRLIKDTGLKGYRWALHIASAVNIAIWITLLPLTMCICKPLSAYWTFGESDKCMSEGAILIVAGVTTCIADLATTLLPIPMIMKLKMPPRERIGVVVLLSLGLVVTIAGIVRTYFTWKSLLDSYDETWHAYGLWMCAAVEIDLAVLCACAPALRPLVMTYAKPMFSSVRSGYGSNSGRGSKPKSFGPLSSGHSNQQYSSPTSQTLSNQDYQHEQGLSSMNEEEFVDLKDMAGIGPRRVSRSKSRQNKKWEIEQTHTLEVRYENRGVPRRSVHADHQDGSFSNSEPCSDWRIEDRPHTQQEPISDSTWTWPDTAHSTQASGPNTRKSIAPVLPSLRTRSPEPLLDERSTPFKSFFNSQPSLNGDEEPLAKRDTPPLPAPEQPLQSARALHSQGEVQDDEGRWDTKRNSFYGAGHASAEGEALPNSPRSAVSAVPSIAR